MIACGSQKAAGMPTHLILFADAERGIPMGAKETVGLIGNEVLLARRDVAAGNMDGEKTMPAKIGQIREI